MSQSEAILENNLISQLTGLGYTIAAVHDGDSLLSNLKAQLERFNGTTFTSKEFAAILNYLAKGNVFEKAKTLRDRFNLTREDACLPDRQGTTFYVRFFNNEDWSKNLYQVTNQVEQQGSFLNRYDVTLLVNGLPLVQIELKRRGIEIKEAFNQINRYQKHSFWSNHGLFQYVQVFIISNGANTGASVRLCLVTLLPAVRLALLGISNTNRPGSIGSLRLAGYSASPQFL